MRGGGAFGPFASEAEARSFGSKFTGILTPGDGGWGVAKVHGLGGTAEERAGGGFGYCVAEGCGHPAYAHSMAGTSRGKCVTGPCKCEQYAQAAAKPRAKSAKKKATA